MIQSQVVDSAVSAGRIAQPQWNGPLFVVGAWRSGTSLLYALLNKHPQIALMYEGDLFLLRWLFRMPGAASTWLARWELWNDALRRHGVDVGRNWSQSSRVQAAMETAHREYARQKGALIWGDKSPNYYDCLTHLARDFPAARFIIIWRDPIAVCRSVISAAAKGNSWFSRRGMPFQALMAHKSLKVERDRLVAGGAPVYEIQYESLVTNVAGVMAGACEFLGIPFSPAVASLDGADRSAIYEGGHHALVKGERIISSLGRPEVLTPALKQKIGRYVCLWREQSGSTWPPFVAAENQNESKPGLLERFLDECSRVYFRSLHRAAVVIYSFAPLRLLKAYRAHRCRRWEASLRATQGEAINQSEADLS
jgi:hypothetical protein